MKDNDNRNDDADSIALFCRLQMNSKRDIPIRSSEMGVLIFTYRQIDPVTPRMISDFFKITKPSVTAMVNSLLKNDYMRKIPSSTDRRSYSITATDKGIELVVATYKEYFRTIVLLEKKMGSKEFNYFMDMIKKANNILSEDKVLNQF